MSRDRALFRGGPKDGETLEAHSLPSEVRYVQLTPVSDCDWDHVYQLRGTPETGWYYAHEGHRLVGPPGETYQCPACHHRFTIEDVLRMAPTPTESEDGE